MRTCELVALVKMADLGTKPTVAEETRITGFDMDDLLKQLNSCVGEKPGQIDLHYYVDAYDELYK